MKRFARYDLGSGRCWLTQRSHRIKLLESLREYKTCLPRPAQTGAEGVGVTNMNHRMCGRRQEGAVGVAARFMGRYRSRHGSMFHHVDCLEAWTWSQTEQGPHESCSETSVPVAASRTSQRCFQFHLESVESPNLLLFLPSRGKKR
jgi:hypothetical protein